ncbi:hypothetical protein EGW08_006377 [Elysia chlorotica]|uniref:Uncharacterized protein n=1 Tax=Elysia chlorotica TaxID=188477 RepID=A0A3S1C8G7_ELYCH|nr:hypothetical protein EGW08_006377 [Elysia chlorotica]
MERSNPVSWKRSNQEEMNDDCSVISATTGGSLSPLLLPCIQRNGIASTTKHKKFNFPALHFSNVSPVIPLQCWSKTSDDDQEFSCMEMSGEEIINSSESSISATALLSAKQPKCLNELSEGPELEMSAQLIMVKENVSGKSNPKNSVESPLNSGWGEVTGTRNQRLSKSFEIFNELPTSSIPNHKDCYTDALTSGTCVGNTDSRTPEIQLSGKRQCLASPNQDLTLPQTVDGERHTLVHSGKKSSLPQTVDGEMTGSRHKFTLHQTVDGDRHTLAHTGQKSTLQIQEDVALTDLQPEKYPCKTCSQELERTSEVQHAPSLSVPESPQTQHSDPRRITGPASLSHCQIVDREMPEEQTLHQQQDHQYTGSDATLSPALVLPEQMSQNPSLNDSQNNTEEKRSQSQNNMGGKESPPK